MTDATRRPRVPRRDASTMVARAEALAQRAHKGQQEKSGAPYFDHVRRVADAVEGETTKTVAFLHDVVEKSAMTTRTLDDEGFPEWIVREVDALTQRDGEDYPDFVRRAGDHAIARVVKRADLEDNIKDTQRSPLGGDEGDALHEKYAFGLQLLDNSRGFITVDKDDRGPLARLEERGRLRTYRRRDGGWIDDDGVAAPIELGDVLDELLDEAETSGRGTSAGELGRWAALLCAPPS